MNGKIRNTLFGLSEHRATSAGNGFGFAVQSSAVGCGRRVAILYGGVIFACRGCHQLVYPCQRENAFRRAIHRANKIRERLGWEPGIQSSHGQKPKGMRWRTFERLTVEHDSFTNYALGEIERRFGIVS